MKRLAFGIALLGTVASVHATETLATSGAVLELDSPKCELAPQLYTPEWHGQRAVGNVERAADGSYPFRMEVRDQGVINGRAMFTQTADGAVEATYTFTPERDIPLNALFVGLALPSDRFSGGAWASDTRNGEFPRDGNDLFVMAQSAKSLSMSSANGKDRLVFTFSESTSVMIQDDRRWGPSFSLRIGYNGSTKTFKANEPFTVRFTLATHEPQRLTLDEPVTIQAGADWIPLKKEMDILEGSALDFTRLGLIDAPAGKHGWVVSKGANFEFERKPGILQRFYGVNICFSANFLEPADAERLAVRLARTGYNALRLHHHDGGLVEGMADGTTLNPGNLARLDALMAACISNGIYVTTDLYVSRSVPWRSVGIERDGKIAMNEYKMLVPVHEGSFENLKTFTRSLLTHVNPHTGRSYAKEPALAWLALVNEGNFGNYLGEMRGIPEWQQVWAAWLAERQAKEPDAYRDIPATIPDNYYVSNRHTAVFTLFLKDMEDRFVTRLKAFLSDELGCRALVTDRSAWTNRASDQVPRSELFDYVDDHFYVDHPHFLEQPWRLPSRCDNKNPLKNEAMGAQNVVFTRLLDKPFTITEYNYSGPGRFRGMGGIVTGTLGALQDWAGIWRFAYSHQRDNVLNGGMMGYFDMAGDPLSLAAERASICLFLRGDLPVLKRTYAMVLPKAEVLKPRDTIPMNATKWPWLAWYARMGTIVADAAPAGTDWSERYPAVYDAKSDDIWKLLGDTRPETAGDGAVVIDRESGMFVLKTPRTCGGFTEQGIVDAGDLIFDTGDAAATVWVSALDGASVRDASRLLLTHLTDVQNTGIRYAQQSRKTLLAWGGLPHLARNGKAEVRLAVKPAESFKVYALSTSGRRVAEVATHVVKGRLAFTAAVDGQPDSATLLYEIVKEK